MARWGQREKIGNGHTIVKTLEQLFQTTFHSKQSFSDFLELDTSRECSVLKGPDREIIQPSEKLKAFHRFLNSFVFSYADICEEVVFSYRKGKNILDAVSPHAGSRYFLQTDLKDFFQSLNSDDVSFILERKIEKCPVTDIKTYIPRIVDLTTLENRLPVGFATSPPISNSCLLEFDEKLSAFSQSRSIIYTRYSDDLILSSDSKDSLIDALDFVHKNLNDIFNDRLRVNNAKTKFSTKGNKIKILGLSILPSGKVTVDKIIKDKIETLLYFYINDKNKFTQYSGKSFEKAIGNLSGQLTYIKTVDSDYIKKLRKKYGNHIIDIFYHKSVK